MLTNMLRVRCFNNHPEIVLSLFYFLFLIPIVFSECWYNEKSFEESMEVITAEPCLNCTCTKGVLLCYLRVCPTLPNPPPVGCILLHRFKTCCPELICTGSMFVPDGLRSNYHLAKARSDLEEEHHLETKNAPLKAACVINGSIYAPGSAMASSSLCEYCYCLGGKQICVKPKCLLPIKNCLPIYDSTSCCPVYYNCSNAYQISTTTTAKTTELQQQKGGCVFNGIRYKEGSKVLGVGYSECDNCYCLEGILRCEPLSCAPALLGCEPIIKKGECCASSYNCTTYIVSNETKPERNYGLPIVSKEYSKFNKEQKLLTHNRINSKIDSEIKRNSYLDPNPTKSFYRNLIKPNISDVNTTIPAKSGNDTSSNEKESSTKSEQNYEITKILNDVDTTTDSLETTLDVATKTEEPSTEPTTLYSENAELNSEIPTTPSAEIITMQTVLNSTDCIQDNSSLLQNNEIAKESKPQFRNNTVDLPETSLNTVGINVTSEPETSLDNITKMKNPDYEYDYHEATLPPSLPNLQIIPFVAADAVDLKDSEENVDSNMFLTDMSFINHNLFSPPVETEGGFVPKEPSSLDNFYENSISSTLVPLIQNTYCIIKGQRLLHGDPTFIPSSCESCMCFHGDLVCENIQCSTINCQILENENLGSCCPQQKCDISQHNPGLANNLSLTENPITELVSTRTESNLDSITVNRGADETQRITTPAATLQNSTSHDWSFDSVLDLLFSNYHSPTTTDLPRATTAKSATPSKNVISTPGPTVRPNLKNKNLLTNSNKNHVTPNLAILKLAGCNIYGRMYRVGRIISELSNSCLECRCTESGVQCRTLC